MSATAEHVCPADPHWVIWKRKSKGKTRRHLSFDDKKTICGVRILAPPQTATLNPDLTDGTQLFATYKKPCLNCLVLQGLAQQPKPKLQLSDEDFEPDWTASCENCGTSPVMPATGMCGPCSTGEASTLYGDW